MQEKPDMMIAFATLYNSYLIALPFMFNISEIMEQIPSGNATCEMSAYKQALNWSEGPHCLL